MATKTQCKAWFDNPAVNPSSNRAISYTGNVFQQLERACGKPKLDLTRECNQWGRDQTVNPQTLKPIKPTGRVYAFYEKSCNRPMSSLAVQFIKLVDKTLFDNRFKSKLTLKFAPGRQPIQSVVEANGRIVLKLATNLLTTELLVQTFLLWKLSALAALNNYASWVRLTLMGASTFPYLEPIKQWNLVGTAATVGEGDVGQLGLGVDVYGTAAITGVMSDAVSVVAGGMHTACLRWDGTVYTFGCNDNGALGRETNDEDECFVPEPVDLEEPGLCLSAGNSHTAMLSPTGNVWLWGSFRNSNGDVSSVSADLLPLKLDITDAVKIVSGADHLAVLTGDGSIFTIGTNDQGQLGRDCGGLRLERVPLPPCRDVWAGQYCCIASESATGTVYVWGLNNYGQLGVFGGDLITTPTRSDLLSSAAEWRDIACGLHHTLLVSQTGSVYGLGRHDYGQLGSTATNGLTLIRGPTRCTSVACGGLNSFAVDADNNAWAWGAQSSQLGNGVEDGPNVTRPIKIGNRNVAAVSVGGQHTALLIV